MIRLLHPCSPRRVRWGGSAALLAPMTLVKPVALEFMDPNLCTALPRTGGSWRHIDARG